MTDSLAGWVESELRSRYGTIREIAALIGMSESGFSRGVKRGTLSLENLLDLARATEQHPSIVLRRAGKDRVAVLLEELYGSGRDALTASLRELIEIWEGIPDDVRVHLLVLLRHSRHVAAHAGHARNATPPEARRRRRAGGSRRVPSRSG